MRIFISALCCSLSSLPEHFPHRTVETIRFGDLDRQNHVNNAVFSTFLESGRVIILYGPEYGLIVPDSSFVLARIAIDFLGEMHWPGEVEIGTAVARVGNSSLGLDQARVGPKRVVEPPVGFEQLGVVAGV